jgi:hypothetical protein
MRLPPQRHEFYLPKPISPLKCLAGVNTRALPTLLQDNVGGWMPSSSLCRINRKTEISRGVFVQKLPNALQQKHR